MKKFILLQLSPDGDSPGGVHPTDPPPTTGLTSENEEPKKDGAEPATTVEEAAPVDEDGADLDEDGTDGE